MSNQVLLLELNELTPRLMDQFIAQGCLPNFKKLRDDSRVFTTDARSEGENLNPWVQWVTVHTGLAPNEHKVTRLNKAQKCKGKFIWDTLSKNGFSSWICGSMNIDHESNFNGHFLPDPWAKPGQSFPKGKFEPYFDYVSQSVQSHSSKDRIPARVFISFMLQNGLSLKTIARLASQLAREKINHHSSWRRAMLLDWIQYDLFKYHFKRNKPNFSTFFSNSVAHYQHHYWRDFEPTLFSNLAPRNETASAIRDAYVNTDKIVGEFLKTADDDVVLIFCTALSQQPFTKADRYYYHIHSEAILKEILQISHEVIYSPVMAEQFHLTCSTPEEAEALKVSLDKYDMESDQYFHVGSRKMFHTSVEENVVHVQCRCTKVVDRDAVILDGENNQSIAFHSLFYEMDEIKSGRHHPHGMFWVRDNRLSPHVEDTPIPLEQVHSMISKYFA